MNVDQEMKEIAYKIRKYREINGMTREKFCEKLGVSAEHWGNVERGNKNVSLANLLKVCEIFNIELTDLIPKKDIEDTRVNITILNEKILKMTNKQLGFLISIIDQIEVYIN